MVLPRPSNIKDIMEPLPRAIHLKIPMVSSHSTSSRSMDSRIMDNTNIRHNNINLHHRSRVTTSLSSLFPIAILLRLREDQAMIPAPSPTADTLPRGRIRPIMVVKEANRRATMAPPRCQVHQTDRAGPVKGREDSVRQCSERQVGGSWATKLRAG